MQYQAVVENDGEKSFDSWNFLNARSVIGSAHAEPISRPPFFEAFKLYYLWCGISYPLFLCPHRVGRLHRLHDSIFTLPLMDVLVYCEDV